MIDTILAAPVIVKVLGALSLILVLNSLFRRLLPSIVLAALVLALWSGHSASAIAGITWDALSSTDNLLLLLVVFQVIWLSSQMSASGVMADLVDAVRARVTKRGAMAVLPAVIGLLPMPGGALFSAPLVDSCDADGKVPPGLKARTNHWFRHLWEYWWPLYPGVLLAMREMKLDVWQFMLIGIPLSVCGIAAGYVFLLRHIPQDDHAVPAAERREGARSFLSLVLPIIVVIVCYALVRLGHAGLGLLRPAVAPMNRYLPMAIGLFCAMIVLQRMRPLTTRQWREVLLSRRALSMAVIVAAVCVYAAFVQARLPSGEPMIGRMRSEMDAWGIPLLVIVMLLPLVSGLATGLSVGFVGASFPIVYSLLGDAPRFGEVLATTALAYGFGYIGMLLSPVHVCLVVTSEHFKTQVLRNAAGLLKPAACLLACSFALHALIRWILL